MAKLHDVEHVCYVDDDPHGIVTRRIAVHGGWLYVTRMRNAGCPQTAPSLSSTFVPDPTAEHVKVAAPGLLVTGGECSR